MEKKCDLHTHSVYSDGTCTPAEILRQAEEMGLSHVALTDHNTVSGLAEFLQAADGLQVIPVPGIEFSCGWQGKEVHMLGLFLQPEHFEKVHAFVQQLHQRKDESNRQLVKKLQERGYDLCYDELVQKTVGGHINRAHIAQSMLEKGYVSSVEEAVKGILSPAYGLYRPSERLDAMEAIRFIRSVQGAAVLAHPFLNQGEEELERFLPLAKEAGLDGMETQYPLFDEKTEQAARALAERFSLLESGGSDFHGAIKPHIALGTGKGSLFVPERFARQMEKHVQEKNA